MPTKRTKPASKKPELKLAVQYASALRGLPTRSQFRRWIGTAMRVALSADAELTLRIVGQAEGGRLNAAFRRKLHATNVLSFGYQGQEPVHGAPKPGVLHGDIVLCAPVIAREAREQGKTLAAHYAHLTVHGMLHLQGYDHQRDADANRMERLETAILLRLGYADPYLIQDGPIA
jgi:probable rRNA maturation factor